MVVAFIGSSLASIGVYRGLVPPGTMDYQHAREFAAGGTDAYNFIIVC